jgi:hypothetical protein
MFGQSSHLLHDFFVRLHPVAGFHCRTVSASGGKLFGVSASPQTQGSTPNDPQQPRPKGSGIAELTESLVRGQKRILGCVLSQVKVV